MTLKEYYKKYYRQINKAIADALKEDNISNDVTTRLLLKGHAGDKKMKASLVCKEDCILAGIEIFKKVYKQIDPKSKFQSFNKDGNFVHSKAKILTVESSLRNLLQGERTALNFLQRMSGIATLTNKFVKRLKYKGSFILHTRKTTPNFRLFEIAAVKTGGGDFHRMDLSSAAMIKDNHIEALGNIAKVMSHLSMEGNKLKKNKKILDRFEIEVKNISEIKNVIKYGKGIVKIVMLDNFKPEKIVNAVKILKQNGFKIELSGGINEKNFDKFQYRSIDYYSIGELTHSYKSNDFSLDL